VCEESDLLKHSSQHGGCPSTQGGTLAEVVFDKLNDRDNHVFILNDDVLGATVRSKYIEMETG
jgi:hypothetical protein